MNRRKDSRIPEKSLIDEGLAERDEAEVESEVEEFVSAPLLNIGEAARYLGIGRKALYRLIEGGEVEAVRSGHSLRVEINRLEALKRGGKTLSL